MVESILLSLSPLIHVRIIYDIIQTETWAQNFDALSAFSVQSVGKKRSYVRITNRLFDERKNGLVFLYLAYAQNKAGAICAMRLSTKK